MLSRLRIRGKLALVVALPLLAVALLTLPSVAGAVARAQQAEHIRDSVDLAGRVAALISEMRQERLLSLGYLFEVVDRSRLVAQSARVTDQLADIALDAEAGELAGDRLSEPVTAALADTRALAELREPILAMAVPPEQVHAGFGNASLALINSLLLVDEVDLATAGGRQLAVLDASLRVNEAATQATDLLLILTATGDEGAAIGYIAALRLLEEQVSRFDQYATAEQVAQLDLMNEAYAVRDETGVGVPLGPDPWEITAGRSAAEVFPPLDSLSQLGRFVVAKVVTDALIDVDAQRRAALGTAYLVALGAALVVLAVLALTTLLARAVARPLLGLTHSAHRVAQVAETELARIADDESESASPPAPIRIEPVHAQGRDEIAALGRAFDRVQGTAVRLVDRQVASRRNVALMFGYLGRRTQNLVSRQIALIDQLEQHETDSSRLADLYRLDHISSRLRRNAGSLAALSGAVGADEHVAPLPLADIVRLALGEIEDFSRVDVEVPASIVLAPAVIADLVLVLAELMENATTFSPPHTRVSVSAATTGTGAILTIVDHGIGMSPIRLAEENARLAHRERLDLAPTEVLGLFVVGRLTRRHGLRVALSQTTGGGVTADIEVDQQLLTEVAPAPRVVARAPRPADEEADPQPEHGHGQLAINGVASMLVDVEVLGKATSAVAAGCHWNAFALPAGAPTADPAPPALVPAGSDRPAGLRRRVPGATLDPAPAAAAQPGSAIAHRPGSEPDEARALIEQLQLGVARAMSELRANGAMEE